MSNRDDLRAVISARRDLGAEYEDPLVDSFLDKLDVEIAARVRNEVDARTRHQKEDGPRQQRKDTGIVVALGSLALGIPLTGIAAAQAHGTGLLLAWAGIVGVNLAFALGRRRER
ncbi:hypothetical protein JOL79_10095 [Microbispora sp. RL4-1S]|uniref:Uncharacterized protein n=1 Tax=Microbispora oryzae TaxID=2806554 RepID=A0A940WEU3_9ACTN|nr:hypothetical protein [Microbispora oryzae]MBP2704161.1 hypothetical protein [Microbispora oryzae]